MNNLHSEIERLEVRAAESLIIADLAIKEDAKNFNRSLSRQLLAEAELLRRKTQLPDQK